MKRFYKLVSTHRTPAGFEIHLDGKPVKTPLKHNLQTLHSALADAIVREWAEQEDDIIPGSMPLTQILSTQIDKVATERGDMTAAIMKYLDTDLICYRTDHPPDIAKKQQEAWDPWINWFKNTYVCSLQTTTGLTALHQDENTHKTVLDYVESMEVEEFTILQMLVPATGSLVLPLAFLKGAIDTGTLYNAIRVEERHKEELYDADRYGSDPAQQKKDDALRIDITAARRFLDLTKSGTH